MASPKRTRIYPSDRFPADKAITLNTAIQFLMQIRSELSNPHYDDTVIKSATLVIDKTQQCVFELWATIPRTDEQVKAEQLAKLLDALKTAPREGLTVEQITALLNQVERIAD